MKRYKRFPVPFRTSSLTGFGGCQRGRVQFPAEISGCTATESSCQAPRLLVLLSFKREKKEKTTHWFFFLFFCVFSGEKQTNKKRQATRKHTRPMFFLGLKWGPPLERQSLCWWNGNGFERRLVFGFVCAHLLASNCKSGVADCPLERAQTHYTEAFCDLSLQHASMHSGWSLYHVGSEAAHVH